MSRTKKLVLLFILSVLLFSFTAAVGAAEQTIAVTIVPQIEMVEAVAGDKVEIVEMIPKGFSPSNYSPSPREMRAFGEASIYFSMGVPADIQNILPRAEEQEDLKVVKLFEEVEKKYPYRYFGEDEHSKENVEEPVSETDEHAGHDHSGGRDPHIWLSPDRAAYMVKIIRDNLIELMPKYENEFKANTDKYLKKLNSIDQQNKELLSPYKGEEILVYHPSFGYFADHYKLKMMAIEKDGKEPGPRYLQEIIADAADRGIKNVFYQAEIDSRKTKAVAESLNGESIKLTPLAENYAENLKIMAKKIAEAISKRDGK